MPFPGAAVAVASGDERDSSSWALGRGPAVPALSLGASRDWESDCVVLLAAALLLCRARLALGLRGGICKKGISE